MRTTLVPRAFRVLSPHGLSHTKPSGPTTESAAARAIRYGLVAAWNLNEASGQRNDAYGTNHLTDNNTVTTNAAKLGANAAQFTAASSEYLSIADNAPLSTGDIDFWWAAWVYLDDKSTGRTIAAKGTPSTWVYEYFFAYSSGPDRFVFDVSNGSSANQQVSANALGSPSTGTWYFLVAYHDAVSNLVGISGNGGAFTTVAYTSGGSDNAVSVRLGADSGGTRLWDGRMDAMCFGKSPPGGIAALASELRDYLYAGGTGREYPGGWT